ncbi:response regulator transcription factor [Niallia hominis]|uniref:Response regulator n=1 Tax=Niallia hominis TaxID=3133173 RepID=A0ABV1EY81_9BACI
MCVRLMIVEDENLEKKALRKIITSRFPEIQIVAEPSTGYEALKEAKQTKPDIIFMDIGLPELDGLSVQEELVDFLPKSQTIVLTAYSDFEYAHKALKIHVADYLLKPVRKELVIQAIDKVLSTIKNDDKPVYTKEKNTPILSVENSHPAIQKAIDLVTQKYKTDIKVKDIAKELYLNPQYFSRLFKKEMNISFMGYLLQYRLEKAKEMLKETDLPIYAISQKCGFTDSAYFCKKFLQQIGTTPLKYRKTSLL